MEMLLLGSTIDADLVREPGILTFFTIPRPGVIGTLPTKSMVAGVCLGKVYLCSTL